MRKSAVGTVLYFFIAVFDILGIAQTFIKFIQRTVAEQTVKPVEGLFMTREKFACGVLKILVTVFYLFFQHAENEG